MRGDRFKTRLPNFIGKISDMNDLFIAEDREFEKIDYLLMDFINALFVEGIKNIENPEYFLRRLEKEYGIDSLGNVDERVAKILLKMRGARTTTVDVILEICNLFGYRVDFIERYSEYGFTLDFHGTIKFNGRVLESIEVVKPAHLDFDIRFIFHESFIYKDKTDTYTNKLYPVGHFHQCGTIYNYQYTGKKVTSNIKLPNVSTNKANRHIVTGETKARGGNR